MVNQKEGLPVPDQGVAVGGKGSDGKFYFLQVTDTGEVVLSADVTIDPTNLATSAKQDTQITAEQAILAILGAASGAAVITDANGTLQQYLRGLVKLLIGTIKTSDNGAAWTASNGVAGARFTSADQSAAVASVSDAPAAGQKLVITDVEISVDTAMRVDVSEETSGTIIASVYMAANSTVNLITRSKRKLATADKKLQVRTSVAGNISVNPFYYSEA